MIYVSRVNDEVSTVSGFYDGTVIASGLKQAESSVQTPFALGLLADGCDGVWAAHKQGVTAELMAKHGWRVLAWHWSSHSKEQDAEKNYRVLFFGKRFKAPAPVSYKTPYGPPFGCSVVSVNTFRQLITSKGPGSSPGPGGARLKLYCGEPLRHTEVLEAEDAGWFRIAGTELFVSGFTPEMLPEVERKRFLVEV